MKHLEERLIEEGLSNTSVQEILQYVEQMLIDEYEEGYTDGHVVLDAEERCKTFEEKK